MSNHAEPQKPPDGASTVAPELLQRRLELELQRRLELERRRSAVDKKATVAMLAANLAHRVGTPLNVIRGRAEHLLRAEHDAPKTIQGLQTIISQVDKIAEAVKILLQLARQDVTRKPCDIRELVRVGADRVHSADERQVATNLELGEVPLVVRCDSDQLEQAFVSLIRSVIEFAGERSRSLTIIARAAGDGDHRIRVAFEPDTCGAAPSVEPQLLDPFSGREEARWPASLELAVAQLIARDHDGEITVEPGRRGAHFVMNLPPSATNASHERIP